jgi:hypothetical protein
MKNDGAQRGSWASIRRGMPLRSGMSPKKVGSSGPISSRFSVNRQNSLPRDTESILKPSDQEGQYTCTGEKKSLFERLNLPPPKNATNTYEALEEGPAPVPVDNVDANEEANIQWIFDHNHNHLALLELESVRSADDFANAENILSDLGKMETKSPEEESSVSKEPSNLSQAKSSLATSWEDHGRNQEAAKLADENITWVESSFADADLSMEELSQAWAAHSRKGSGNTQSTVQQPTEVTKESDKTAENRKHSFAPTCWLGGLCSNEEVVDDKVKENTPAEQKKAKPSPEAIRAMLADAESYGSRLLAATRTMDFKTRVNNFNHTRTGDHSKTTTTKTEARISSEKLGLNQLLAGVPSFPIGLRKNESYLTELSSVLGTRWIDDESSAHENYEDDYVLEMTEPDGAVEVELVESESVPVHESEKARCSSGAPICLSLNPNEWKLEDGSKMSTNICTVADFSSIPVQDIARSPESNQTKSCSVSDDPTRGLQEFISQTW